jgi:hypothetical protein
VKYLLLLVTILVPACSTAPAAAPDAGVAVVWNRVDEPHQVCESLSGRKSLFNVLGCSQWQEPVAQGAPRVCAIYAPAPRNERDMQRFATLGHELMHCFDGNWHDRWGRMNSPTKQASANAAAGGSSPTVR